MNEDETATLDDNVTVSDGSAGEKLVVWESRGQAKETYHEVVAVVGIMWCLRRSGVHTVDW